MSFFSCTVVAEVEMLLLTVPKALRADGKGVFNIFTGIGDFKSFSGGERQNKY